MSLIDSILNLAALLLWFGWRSRHFDPLVRRRPATLVGTLRPAQTVKGRDWMILGSIPALLLLRALLYWQIGAPADWVPKLDLGLVVIAFRVDSFWFAVLFSAASFLRLSAIVYFWLVAFCVVNRPLVEPDAILRLIRLQLGRFARAPLWIQIITPILVTTILWSALHPLLSWGGILSPTRSITQIIRQGLLLTGGLFMTLKLLFPVILLLHMLTSYVYLGSNPLWDFVDHSGKNILALLHLQKLRSAKLDFAPLAGILILIVVFHTLPILALNFAASQGMTVWPE